MKNIRLSVFDIFAYIIPGLSYLILISVSSNFVKLEQMIAYVSSISFNALLIYLFISYLIGFTFDSIGAKYQSLILSKLRGHWRKAAFEKFKKENPNTNISNYKYNLMYAQVEISSPISTEKADHLSALGNMSRNLSLSFLLYSIVTIVYNIFNTSIVNWIFFPIKIIGALLISYLLLSQSYNFKRFSHSHLINCYSIITAGTVKESESVESEINKK